MYAGQQCSRCSLSIRISVKGRQANTCVCVCVSTDGHLFGPEEEEEIPENVLQIINKQATTS